MAKSSNRYTQIIERIFEQHYKEGDEEVSFVREDIERAAGELNIDLPKNMGDVTYSFRYRTKLPPSISAKAPADKDWIIRSAGRSQYRFVAVPQPDIRPREGLAETKVPDATPGLVTMYALDDEQSLLAKMRYNRLIDIFTGVTCYSLQNHLRTSVKSLGQIETDELYVGVDQRGAHYVFPVEAKGAKDKFSIVQIEQDCALCDEKFKELICRAIAAQFVEDDLIALFELVANPNIAVTHEKHYRLVPPEQLSAEEIRAYGQRTSNWGSSTT